MLIGNLIFAVWLTSRPAPTMGAPADAWLTSSIMLVPVLACFSRALLGGPRRAGAAWLGVAITAYAAGNFIYIGWTQFLTDPPTVSPADVAYLTVYPCVAAAVLCLGRGEEGRFARGMWLDGALGAGGAATSLAVVLSPLQGSAPDAGFVWVGAAFVVADILLIAIIFGILAVRGLRGGSMWMWLGLGLGIYCTADVVYALRVASDTYVVANLWSSLWVAGLTVAAFAVWRPEQPLPAEHGRSMATLMIPTVAMVAAVVALVICSIEQLPSLVIVLATLTLALAALRTMIAFRQVGRLSDARRQAVTDELTGLGNRRALFACGNARLKGLEPSSRLALMIIDLDDFKAVNDTLGHSAGDELLCEIARRLAARVRHPDLLVRLGGDEFAVVFELEPEEDSRSSAERMIDRISQPFVMDGVRIHVLASVGIAETRGNTLSMIELLRQADVAMYSCKAQNSQVEVYDAVLDETNRSRLQTVQDLEAAIRCGQFVLHYQPKIDVADGAIVGVEALVRWQHPQRGLLGPDAFLPIVEQCGLMSSVTRLVLQTAIEQIAAWRASGLAPVVAVNISASDLRDEHLAERIVALLDRHAVPAEALELEVTESVLMVDPVRARDMLERLRRLGLRIAVDDFGTGYCALAYLRDLPVDLLKIDRTFITHMASDPRSCAIVRSTIELAHALGMEVVAEGVEDQRVLAMLGDFECDYAQGYHFSRPLPAADFAVLHASRRHSSLYAARHA